MYPLPDVQDDRRSRLLAALPAIAWSASVGTFRFTYVSPAAETILGYPAERWLEEPNFWTEHLHPEDRHIPRLCHNETVAGRDHELVYRMIAADGRTVWLRDYVNVYCIDGVPVELFGVMVDITREREAERMRVAAEAKFRWIVEQSVVAVYMLSSGRLTYINDTGAKMLGYTAEELTSVEIPTLLHEKERPASILDGGQRVACVRRKDGTPLHVAYYQSEVLIDGEKIIIGTAADVTESLLARQALEASEQRYRELVEDVTDILYTVDRNGCFVSLSRSFERSTGYRVEDWIGRPFAELFVPRHAPAAMEPTGQSPGEDSVVIREYDLPARSGALVTVEVSSQPRYVDGVAAGTIGMARDVTEQRTAARRLEDANRMSSLGQVAASLAHEFNNVLMGIQPFVEVIARSAVPTRVVSDSLGHITRAIGRGKRASQEILRFANPQEPQLFAFDARVWLPTLLGQLVATLPPSIALSSSMEPGACFIRGDREHLEQVITNLVFNARDAIAGSGTIHVGVSFISTTSNANANADLVCISISDDGPGIAPEMLGRIFEPLFTTKRNGTGLGLAIARRLMEGQGGTLTAESRPERGSVFRLLVPAAEAPTPSQHAAAWATREVTRVLIIEDDLSVGAGLEALLTSEGYETTWVRFAADACEAARRVRPQLAIIDVNLPDGNGIDLIPLLRAEHIDLPVILSTGHIEVNLANDEKRILSLMKPYELSELLAAIGTVTAAA
jgi:PAS domain S-box-containing protein